MLVQQAIFTSVRSGRNEGYQIAASSPGISAAELRELAHWGPSHDSLYTSIPAVESVNFQRMENGRYCVSQTVLAGREYSGRGGERVYTQLFLVPEELMRRFSNSPFRVMEALEASGRFTVWKNVPRRLDPLPLVGRASFANVANLEYVNRKLGPHKLASLVCAAEKTPFLGVSSTVIGRRLFSALLDLLPPPNRLDFSLATGLKVTASRPYRLSILPPDREEYRRAIRQVRLTVLDLTKDTPSTFAPHSGWPLLVHQLLRAQQYETLARVVESTANSFEQDFDLLAEQWREKLDKDAEQSAVLTPFSA